VSALADEVARNPRLKQMVLEFLDAELSATKDDIVRASAQDDILRKQGAARALQHMRNTLAR